MKSLEPFLHHDSHLGPAFPLHVRILAWCVHGYTALGLLAAAAMAILLAPEHPEPNAYRHCFLLMIAATVVDATDGTLARRIRIKEVVPGFDGRRLDDLVDWLTYACMPLALLARAGIPFPSEPAWLLIPLFASAYGFCQTSIKTDDGYFLGWPSCWNLVAFFLYAMAWPGWLNLALILLFAFLTFVPLRYLYPSQPGRLNRWTNILGGIWSLLLTGVVVWAPLAKSSPHWSLYPLWSFPIYYLAASWFVSWKLAR